jgi:TolB-like protein/AraC-like DNA-binding protein
MEDLYSMGDQFLVSVRRIIEENLDNENFSVEDLARYTQLSRSMLHRKLIKLTGKSATDLITEIRLLRAKKLLENDMGTASEIAYKVGFGSPSYFHKVFKKYFKVSPGDVRKGATIIAPQVSSNQIGKIRGTILKKKRILTILSIMFFLLVFIGASLYFLVRKEKPAEKSILILPFDNLSANDENQYFADGITEDILNNLFLISDLRVISRTTSKHFVESKLTAAEIARMVNARNVLEGSVRRYGNKARISVQLIDAHQDKHLWSENFDRELNDILGVQGDIALQVALKLNAVISEKEKKQLGKIYTQNTEAYDNYLKGRFLLHKANSEQRFDFDYESVMNCLQYYEKAIALDSNFAAAYAGLANARFNLSAWGWLPPAEGGLKAIELSMRALAIDPDCAEAHAVKGAFHVWGERKFEEGRKEFITAVGLNPNFATTHQWYAQLLMITGPIEEARIHIDRAVELEPYFWVVQNVNAWIYYFEKKYDKAIEACIIARDLKPNFLDNTWLFFLNYAKLGEGEKAVKELQNIVGTCPGTDKYAEEISDTYNKSGIKGLFSWLIDVNMHKPIPVMGMDGYPFYIAWWNAILGNKEESIYWLQKNMESKNKLYFFFDLIATCPDFNILHDDPRFLRIIEEIGLALYHTRATELKKGKKI